MNLGLKQAGFPVCCSVGEGIQTLMNRGEGTHRMAGQGGYLLSAAALSGDFFLLRFLHLPDGDNERKFLLHSMASKCPQLVTFPMATLFDFSGVPH